MTKLETMSVQTGYAQRSMQGLLLRLLALMPHCPAGSWSEELMMAQPGRVLPA
jgi:hypothetical protein